MVRIRRNGDVVLRNDYYSGATILLWIVIVVKIQMPAYLADEIVLRPITRYPAALVVFDDRDPVAGPR
jgi:hypothetical protein